MIACFGLCPIEWAIAGLLALGIGGTKLANYLKKKRCGEKGCCKTKDGENSEEEKTT